MEAKDLKIGTKLIQKRTGFKCVISRHKEGCQAFKLCWEVYPLRDSKWYHIDRILLDFDLVENSEKAEISESLTKDNVNSPSHYTQGGIETIDFIEAKLTREELIGAYKYNVLKYAARSNLKNGEEDLRKMNYYSNRLIKILNEKV